MIVQLLGFLDFAAAVLLFLMKFDKGLTIGLYLGIYLLIKGIVFFSWASMVDVVTGVLMVLASFGTYFSFNFVFVFWLMQKAFFSFYNGS